MIQDRYFFHPKLTLYKALKFGVTSIVGAGIVGGGTWVLTEYVGLHYMASTLIAGVVAFGIKFLMSALWAFARV